MSRTISSAKWILLCIISFGISSINVDASEPNQDQGQAAKGSDSEDAGTPGDGTWVEVEPTNLLPSDVTGIYYLVPYRNRREKWGTTVSLGYSSFTPKSYEPNFVAADFSEVYGRAELPLVELVISKKRNFLLGSIGAEIGVGTYNNGSDPALITSKLDLKPIRLGAVYYLDNAFFEPYVVPYVAGGGYLMMFKESMSGTNTFGGNTQVSMYYTLGLELQLNWIDREAARISYMDSGVENTFIYVNATQHLKSVAAADPDFSTGLDWGAGVRIEF